MPRAKGTYVTLDRWVFELAPKLPGAAGVILERLSAQSNYQQKSLTVGQLCHYLPYKERAVQNALAYLVAEGYAEAHADTYYLRQPSVRICASNAHGRTLATRTDMRLGQAVNAVPAQENEELNPAIEVHNKKEEKEEKEVLITTAAQPSPRPAPVKVSKPKAEPKDPTAFQLLFVSLALACYGGTADLTAPASSRIGSAAKVLLAASYTGPDVPLIAAWIGAQEKWRTGPLSPQTIAERAPAWKQGVKANPGKMPKSNELDAQDWAEESRMADLRNSGIDLSPASSGWN